MKNIAKTRLQIEREKRYWTQAELAEQLGVDTITVSRWERDVQRPGSFHKGKLSKLFGQSVDNSWFRLAAPDSSSSLWSVPFQRNPFFTYDERTFSTIRERLVAAKGSTSILTVSGIGGMGKTQLVLEYAYKYKEDYRAVFWVNADTQEQIEEDLVTLATLVHVPETHKREPNPKYLLHEFYDWLRNNPGWLLILDNVNEKLQVRSLLRLLQGGHVLLTTRTQGIGEIAENMVLEKMHPEIGALLLLRSARFLTAPEQFESLPLSERRQAVVLARRLDGLPLALDQAGSYMHATGCSLYRYILLYRQYRKELLEKKQTYTHLYKEYDETVATTWLVTFRQIKERSSPALALLHLCSFLYADSIPEHILIEGTHEPECELHLLKDDELALNDAYGVLLNYSMIRRNVRETAFSMHRLVQLILRDGLDENEQGCWAERAVRIVARAFTTSQGQHINQYFPHGQICAVWMKKYALESIETTHLLERVALLAYERGWYSLARPLLLRAYDAFIRQLGEDDPQVFRLFLHVAQVHMELGLYSIAISCYQKAKTVYEHFQEPHDLDILHCLNTITQAQLNLGNIEAAIENCREMFSIYNRLHLYSCAEFVTTAQIAAEMYTLLNETQFGRQFYLLACSKSEQVFGNNHPKFAFSLMKLVAFYQYLGENDGVKPLIMQALDIYQKTLGSDHPKTAQCLMSLAATACQEKDYQQAEQLSRRALTIRQQKLGLYHSDIASNLRQLANILQLVGNDTEAEILFLEALDVYKHAGGSETPGALLCAEEYAVFLRERGRPDEANIYQQQVVSARMHIAEGRKRMRSFVLEEGNGDLFPDIGSAVHIWEQG